MFDLVNTSTLIEIQPVELFYDRLEITSVSGLPQGFSQDEFCFTDNFTCFILPFSQVLEATEQCTGQA